MPRVAKAETQAQNNPVIIKKALESDVGSESVAVDTLVLGAEAPAIEVGGEKMDKTYYDELAFMEEEIVVMLHTLYRNDAKLPFIQVWNNGREFRFFPNTEQKVKRKFVNELARKNIVFDQEQYIDQEGAKSYRYPASANQRYRFDIINDPSPQHSAQWRAQLRQRV
jgi:hypothetical protein